MDGWSLRVGEKKLTGEEPMSSIPALLPAAMQGE